MTQQVEAPAAQAWHPAWTLGAHVKVEGETQLHKAALSLHMHSWQECPSLKCISSEKHKCFFAYYYLNTYCLSIAEIVMTKML